MASVCATCGLPIVPRAGAPSKRSRWFSLVSDDGYTFEEVEAMRAVEQFKRENNQPFPTICDILQVLKGVGWSKPSA